MRRLLVLLPVLIAFQAGVPPALAWTWPAAGPVLRPFTLGDDPYAGGQHRGVDIAGEAGTPVRAPAAGVVSFAGTIPGGGRAVTVQTAAGYSVTLVHLGSIAVERDEALSEGATVGVIGPTGDVEHLEPYVHLGIRLTSDPHGYLDPLSFLAAREAPLPPVPPAPVSRPGARGGSGFGAAVTFAAARASTPASEKPAPDPPASIGEEPARCPRAFRSQPPRGSRRLPARCRPLASSGRRPSLQSSPFHRGGCSYARSSLRRSLWARLGVSPRLDRRSRSSAKARTPRRARALGS